MPVQELIKAAELVVALVQECAKVPVPQSINHKNPGRGFFLFLDTYISLRFFSGNYASAFPQVPDPAREKSGWRVGAEV